MVIGSETPMQEHTHAHNAPSAGNQFSVSLHASGVIRRWFLTPNTWHHHDEFHISGRRHCKFAISNRWKARLEEVPEISRLFQQVRRRQLAKICPFPSQELLHGDNVNQLLHIFYLLLDGKRTKPMSTQSEQSKTTQGLLS